jgi:2-hydroxychromene-2-carboxylate isomerase
MGIKSLVVSRVAESLMGEGQLVSRRNKAEAARKRAGNPHLISYFHQIDDPYSHIAAQALSFLLSRYNVELKIYLVGPPAEWATPERSYLRDYARRDCEKLAEKSGLHYPYQGWQPSIETGQAALEAACAVQAQPNFLKALIQIGSDLWTGPWTGPSTSSVIQGLDVAAILAKGEAKRGSLGHFMSAMIHYEGEWYWGLDRLHYLEARLAELGLRLERAPDEAIWTPPATPRRDAIPATSSGSCIEYFLSFRSPYTYIATKRAKALADAYNVPLKLRFVLPMVMRGLAVPPMKSRYFSLDTAREARRLGLPFGRICDPLGKPVERGYALLPWAVQQGRGYEYCLSFMEKVWSQGVDAGTDAGLAKIVNEAGLDWNTARGLLNTNDWRAEAENNRLALAALGHWGVPCFKFQETVVWGQDRLWVIEDALRANL